VSAHTTSVPTAEALHPRQDSTRESPSPSLSARSRPPACPTRRLTRAYISKNDQQDGAASIYHRPWNRADARASKRPVAGALPCPTHGRAAPPNPRTRCPAQPARAAAAAAPAATLYGCSCGGCSGCSAAAVGGPQRLQLRLGLLCCCCSGSGGTVVAAAAGPAAAARQT
jgi:hypothetical protein